MNGETCVNQCGLGIEIVVLKDKCEEVVPLKHLPMEIKYKPSLWEPLVLESKPLPEHLEYA